MGRGKQRKPTMYFDKIPDDYECEFCHKDKTQVNFRVNETFGSYVIEKCCNSCRLDRKALRQGLEPTQAKRDGMKKKFDDYFKKDK